MLIAGVFGVSLYTSFQELDEHFLEKRAFKPTQVFSDLIHIAPQQSRNHIERILGALHLTFHSKPNVIEFQIPEPQYPLSLHASDDPTSQFFGQLVQFHFVLVDGASRLESITVGDQVLPYFSFPPLLIATLSDVGVSEIREFLSFPDIPAFLWKAVLAVEDQHFLDHAGFDLRGIARAIIVNLKKLSLSQGGSTITQQLVKNLEGRRTKNILLKAQEFFLAILLEWKYSKELILERYLNEVYLGQVGQYEVHGIAQGARYFFGKKVGALSVAEMAFMVGQIRGTGYYSPYKYRDRAIDRQHTVLKLMHEQGFLSNQELTEAKAETIRLAPPQLAQNRAPYFIELVKTEVLDYFKTKGQEQENIAADLRIYTTLDYFLNADAQKETQQYVSKLEGALKPKAGLRLEAASVVLENETGRIRALIGGRDFMQSLYNRAIVMERQVGSTFKTLVYANAFLGANDSRGVPYGPAYPMKDFSWSHTYDQGRQTWAPKNYEGDFRGWTNLCEALANSINTVAAQLGTSVGNASLFEMLRTWGYVKPLQDFPSVSLGVAEMTPLELAELYQVIASRGTHAHPQAVRAIVGGNGVTISLFSPQTKKVSEKGPLESLTSCLREVMRTGTGASAQRLGLVYDAVGKTGTTSHYRDSWFAGFTKNHTAVSWVGWDQIDEALIREKKWKLTGGGTALPLWIQVINSLSTKETPLPDYTDTQNIQIDVFTGEKLRPDCTGGKPLTAVYANQRIPTSTSCEKNYSEPK